MPCCIFCHRPLTVVGIDQDRPIAFLCQHCFIVWQINIGYNPWINRHDPEILEPRFA